MNYTASFKGASGKQTGKITITPSEFSRWKGDKETPISYEKLEICESNAGQAPQTDTMVIA